ncbi:MAG: hypothetical protein M1812_005498 [Candelaria pacifica]|nr:MAG: hypothetical protein M1812_005498 [Candelaria pacifica]
MPDRTSMPRNEITPFSIPLMAWPRHSVAVASTKPFPFQRLPPEIRNQIYRELLLSNGLRGWTIWGCFGYCHPNILATCQKINDEATSILYSVENTIGCVVGKVHMARLHNLAGLGGKQALPEFFSRIRKLRMEIQIYESDDLASALLHVLYLCASLLKLGHNLEFIEIQVHHRRLSGREQEAANEKILGPFDILSPIHQVTIQGDVSEGFATAFVKKMTTRKLPAWRPYDTQTADDESLRSSIDHIQTAGAESRSRSSHHLQKTIEELTQLLR